MNLEDQLREYVGTKYKSVREFSIACDVAYSTIDNMFKRGVLKTGMSTISKVCQCLNISMDHLAMGEIKEIQLKPNVDQDDFELYKQLDDIDKAVIRGEMKQMLRADKYQRTAKEA